MKVLITGSKGQLGSGLMETAPDGCEVIGRDIQDFDVSDPGDVFTLVRQCQADIIVNAAAYTAVDRAEDEKDLAFAVNATGAENLAKAALENKSRLIHISTDFVFDGQSDIPYRPEDTPAPISVYGRSKLEGERAVLRLLPASSVIVRTSWLYSVRGSNFVRTMLRLMNERTEISVVEDQIGTPTWSHSLAQMIWKLCALPRENGILHWSDGGEASWFDFAVAIYEEGRDLGLVRSPCVVHAISTAEYPTAARRPPFSVLDKSESIRLIGEKPEHWKICLRQMLERLTEIKNKDTVN